MAGVIIYTTIVTLVTLIFLLIGLASYHSIDPVTINSGETPPKKEELIDVKEWNHAHGRVWFIFAITFFFTSLIFFFGISHFARIELQVFLYCLFIFLEIMWIEIQHGRLKKKLLLKNVANNVKEHVKERIIVTSESKNVTKNSEIKKNINKLP